MKDLFIGLGFLVAAVVMFLPYYRKARQPNPPYWLGTNLAGDCYVATMVGMFTFAMGFLIYFFAHL